MINIDTHLLDGIEKSALSIAANQLLDDIERPYYDKDHISKDKLWPKLDTRTHRNKIILHLLPLERIGGDEGRTGSRVIIGYFESTKTKNSLAKFSFPILIKILKVEAGTRDVLKEESNNYEKVRDNIDLQADGYAHKLKFCSPIEIDNYDYYCSILFSNFITSTKKLLYDSENQPLLNVNSFSKKLLNLKPDSVDNLEKLIIMVYDRLEVFHKDIKLKKDINLIDEYSWYLRGLEKSNREEWVNLWLNEWADEKHKTVLDFNTKFFNPFFTLERLKSIKNNLHLGCIHGDLHPRNIVFDKDDNPKIIDFGWADVSKHVIKDYVLLEANLRFVMLQTELNYAHIDEISNNIVYTPTFKNNPNDYVNSVLKLIYKIRTIAQPFVTNWDREYIIPLFIVSFGLLKYANSHNNHTASRLTVLKLSNYIMKNVFDEKL
jgi:hypothetical protein